jgi:hypothetical protein
MDTAENRLRVMPDYNLSRGTLRLFARMVRDLWDDPSRDPELITAGDIDWSSPRTQTDLLNRLDREKFKAADIEGMRTISTAARGASIAALRRHCCSKACRWRQVAGWIPPS